MKRPHSHALYDRAKAAITGGVSSPSRTFRGVGGGTPVFMARGAGAYLYDVDGNRYIDYLAAFGPVILGHGHPAVTAAVTEAVQNGAVLGTGTALEVEMAERLREAIPSLERIRFVSSGTEAVMTAIRIARAFTGRHRIIKFDGCYHGHSDLALVNAGSGVATIGVPDSAGIPPHVAGDVISIPFNDFEAFRLAIDRYGAETACVLVEPIVGNFGMVMPEPGFLEALRAACDACGALLVYDEVITAFRVGYGGAQNMLGVIPDLTCLGKIIGGGLAIGAYGGRADVMDTVAPLGPAYQAGTLAGNPVSMAAGLATLGVLREPGTYERLDALSARLADGVLAGAAAAGFADSVQLNRVASGFTLYFTPTPVRDYAGCAASSDEQFAEFFWQMLGRGIYLSPSKYEAWFLTIAHSDADIDATIAAAADSFAAMARGERAYRE